MKIIIDGRMINESGIGRYIRNLINNLQIIDKKNEYFILHLENDLKYQDNFHKINANFKWYGISEQVKLPGLLKSFKPDLVHFPHFNIPIFYKGKFIVTIHDLIHQHFSMQRATTLNPFFYKIKQFGYKKIFKNAVGKSEKILVPSNFVKDGLVQEWKVDPGKIIVTPEAVDDKFSKIKVTKKINFPYIFYIGNAHPHKNIEGLIGAFGELRERYPDLSLVLSGSDHYFWQKIRKEFPQKGIIYTGYISDEELVALYKNARCFVMPSLEEGFGIPLLEAMACGCPVVSSNAGSLPEVGGDAVLYFDPAKPDMAEKISQVLDDETLRQQLIRKGLKRYKQFSWQSMAKKTVEVYKDVLANN